MNNITLNWSAEDRARIDKLIGLLEGLNVAAEAKGLIERKVVEEIIYEPTENEAETPQEAPEPTEEDLFIARALYGHKNEPTEEETAAPVQNVSRQDILQKVIALCGAGKKAEAKDIITTYADSVSDLPESSLAEVWDKLTALEG